MWKRVAALLSAALVVLGAVVLLRAWRAGRPLPSRNAGLVEPVDGDAAARHLAEAIRFATISHEDPSQDDAAVRAQLAAWLQASYPRVHATLAREAIGGGLLYSWKGRDSSLAPVLFAAHMDVVPVEPGTKWAHAPFAGEIADGFVWGRGALDDKGSLVGLMEACEALLARGFVPERTILFAFGADEEVGGRDASAISAQLGARGVHLDWALDEGMMVTDGIVRELPTLVAPLGIGEKGYASFELTVQLEGGHASMPPREGAVSVLAASLSRIVAAPMPARLDGVIRLQLDALAGYMPFGRRVALANLWLFAPLVKRIAAAQPAMNAGLRTTLAPTVLQAGEKDNVLPSKARAVVNARIIPGETVAEVREHLRTAIHDSRVSIATIERGAHDPPPLSPVESRGYSRIETAIGRAFPRAVIVPALVLGATDGRHYRGISDGVYRLAPFVLAPDDLARLHGVDERVKVADLTVAVRAYIELLRAAAQR
jgi:carboxypeptidase PM20D1